MVDGHHANGLTRVAMMATSDTLDLGNGEQSCGSPLTITAPGDGFVVVYGSMTVRNNGCATGCTVLARIRHIRPARLPTTCPAPTRRQRRVTRT
jgi:hypothetical protein